MFHKVFSCCHLLLSVGVCVAQTPRLESISIEHGLSQGFISDFCQDKEGFLWFGTNNGLNRYDGQEFLVFKHDPYDSFSVSNDQIISVCAVGEFLCVVTRNGTNLYHRRSQRFFRLPQTMFLPPPSAAYCLSENQHTVWLSMFHTGVWHLYKLSWPEDLPDRLRETLNAIQQVHFERMFSDLHLTGFGVSQDRKTLWLATGREHFFRQTLPHGALEHIPLPVPYLQDLAIQASGDDGVWVLDAQRRAMAWYAPTSNDGAAWRVFPIEQAAKVKLLDYDIRRKLLWVSTDQEVWGFDLGSRFETISRANARFVLPVPENALRAYTDHNGILWIGTNAKGIRKFNPNTGLFRNYAQNHSIYSKPLADRAGNIWIGNLGYDVYSMCLNRSDGSMRPYPLPFLRRKLFETNVVDEPDGTLWFAGARSDTTQTFLIRYEPNTGQEKIFTYPERFLGLVFAMYFDKDENSIWTAHARQLIRFDIATGTFEQFRYDSLPLLHSWVLALTKTTDGSLWAATENGLLRAVPNTGTFSFRLLKNNPADRNSLPGNSIKSLMTDPTDGMVLWIGTAGRGLCRYDLRSDSFRHFGSHNGLSDDVVYGIVADDPDSLFKESNLWLSTNKGLVRFNPNKNTFRYFLKSDGLQDNEFNTFAYGKSPDGDLMFGGVNGLTVFNPKALRATAMPAQVRITSLRANNKALTPRNTPGLLHEGIEFTTSVSLSHDQNNLYIQFIATDLTQPERNQFSFYLEGAEQAWTHTGFNNFAQYLNLSPGEYTFNVKAANSDGVWNDTPTVLHIRINPPWYATIWAYAAYALLLGSVFRIIYRLHLRQKLEHAEAERMKELDLLKSRLYTNITHEFRTPLTVMLGIAEEMKQNHYALQQETLRNDAEMLRRNGQHLLLLINQMLDLAKFDSGGMRLNMVQGDVVTFVKDLVKLFDSFSRSKNIQVHFQTESDAWVMAYDQEKLQAIVSNLLSNAIKFTPANGHVFVQISPSENAANPAIEFCIRDTGIGIPEGQMEHIFDRFYQVDNSATRTGEGTGIGLALVQEMVNLMKGHIRVESRPTIGSEFIVTLPVTNLPDTIPDAPAFSTDQAVFVPIYLPDTKPGVPVVWDSEKPVVLVVEDHADVRRHLVQCLRDRYHILEATDGQVGITLALERVPDLVISDVMMSNRDGFELCDFLKNDERTSHIPIVLLTALAAAEDRIAGLRRGADAYLTKPFLREELLALLENLIKIRQRLQTRYSRGVSRETLETNVLEDGFLQKIREIVEMHLRDAAFDMVQLSREVGMSHSQIFRKIKALTGRSPSVFIRRVRLQHARQLLETTTLSVAQIAYDTGFNSPNYFSRAFLEEFGKTPSELR